MRLRVLSWNLYHGRDFPPDPTLFTTRSRLLGITERNATHLQVNRDLYREFAGVLAAAEWDIALLQESPPRWAKPLAQACDATAALSLTSRNALGAVRGFLARFNPDLIASNEGGSNLTLVRATPVAGSETFVMRPGPRPERRTMCLAELGTGLRVANLHASTTDDLAAEELVAAATHALASAGDAPVILGGDFNVRPRQSDVFAELEALGFSAPSDPGAIDHILAAGLEVLQPTAAWPPERREVSEQGLAIRLSDHAPVEALFRLRS